MHAPARIRNPPATSSSAAEKPQNRRYPAAAPRNAPTAAGPKPGAATRASASGSGRSKSAARDRRAAAERELAGDIIHKTAEQIQQANDVPEEAPADEGKYYEDYTIKSDTLSGSSDGDKPDGKKED